MRAIRWWFAVSMSAVGFALVWAISAYGQLDTQSAVGVATVAATLILAPLSWSASRSDQHRQPSAIDRSQRREPDNDPERPRDQGSQIIVGDVPGEAAAWQERTQLLDRLATVAKGGRPTVICAVTGQRGIGKTQLAASYMRQRAAEGWPVLAWIVADTEIGLQIGLDQLATAAKVVGLSGDPKAGAAAALAWLRVQPGPCLLVYDNAVDPDLIRRMSPTVGSVQTIVTTTDRGFASVGVTVDVDLFTESEAVSYLRERTQLVDDAGAQKVAEELGRLPVALSQAGAVVGRGRRFRSYRSYLERLEKVPLTELLPRQPGDPYPRGAAEAILISLDDLVSVDSTGAARRLLNHLAVLHPAGVDMSMLDQLLRSTSNEGHDAAAMAAILAQRSLTMPTVDQERTVVHRLIQRIVRDRAEQNGELDAVVMTAATAVATEADRICQLRQHRTHLADHGGHVAAILAQPIGPLARKHAMREFGYLFDSGH